jgi:hypothetical protein
MPYYPTFFAPPIGVRLPYHQATTAQRALAADHLQQRLGAHFPSLRASTWPHALTQLQPDLWLVGSAVALAETDLTQLAQHLAAAPELPVLDPPLYGLPALHLAQDRFQTSELTAWALREVAASSTACGPRLYALLCRLAHPSFLAEQVIHAWCWNLASAPPLPPGIPGGGPLPDSAEIQRLLSRIRPPGNPFVGEAPGTLPGPTRHSLAGPPVGELAGPGAGRRGPAFTRWQHAAAGETAAVR